LQIYTKHDTLSRMVVSPEAEPIGIVVFLDISRKCLEFFANVSGTEKSRAVNARIKGDIMAHLLICFVARLAQWKLDRRPKITRGTTWQSTLPTYGRVRQVPSDLVYVSGSYPSTLAVSMCAGFRRIGISLSRSNATPSCLRNVC
jgi:hypothetical protein